MTRKNIPTRRLKGVSLVGNILIGISDSKSMVPSGCDPDGSGSSANSGGADEIQMVTECSAVRSNCGVKVF